MTAIAQVSDDCMTEKRMGGLIFEASRGTNDKTRVGGRTVLKEILSGLTPADVPSVEFLIMPLSIPSASSGMPALAAMLSSVLYVKMSGALRIEPYRGGGDVDSHSSPSDESLPPSSSSDVAGSPPRWSTGGFSK